MPGEDGEEQEGGGHDATHARNLIAPPAASATVAFCLMRQTPISIRSARR